MAGKTPGVFNETRLILQAGASVISSKSVLALTNHSDFILGRALYSIPVQMKNNEIPSSFSTTFVFSVVPPPSNTGGNGLAFFMTPHISPMGAMSSQYLGLFNLSGNGQPYKEEKKILEDKRQNNRLKNMKRL
jgi:hypothetical protein